MFSQSGKFNAELQPFFEDKICLKLQSDKRVFPFQNGSPLLRVLNGDDLLRTILRQPSFLYVDFKLIFLEKR